MLYALGIFCEKKQDDWKDFLQPAVYAHNTAPMTINPILLSLTKLDLNKMAIKFIELTGTPLGAQEIPIRGQSHIEGVLTSVRIAPNT